MSSPRNLFGHNEGPRGDKDTARCIVGDYDPRIRESNFSSTCTPAYTLSTRSRLTSHARTHRSPPPLLLLLARTAPHNRPIDEKRLHGWNKLTRAEMTEYPTAITKYTVLRERAKTERGGRGRIGRKIIAVSKRVRLRIGLAGLFTILLSEYLLGMLSTAGLGKGEKLE